MDVIFYRTTGFEIVYAVQQMSRKGFRAGFDTGRCYSRSKIEEILKSRPDLECQFFETPQ